MNTKRTLLSFLLAAALLLTALFPHYAPARAGASSGEDGGETLTEQSVYEAMIALQDKYPNGTPWDNSNVYAWQGGLFPSGYGCVAFACMLSDAAFGILPARRIVRPFDYDELRVGDILRIRKDTHTVIILEVTETEVIAAEGNNNGVVRWGRHVPRAEVEAAAYYITRWPEEEPQGKFNGWYFETDPAEEGWEFIDADGDGMNWTWTMTGMNTESELAYEGDGLLVSMSYYSSAPINADNWAVSPEVTLPEGKSHFTFYAKASNNYYVDSFEVYLTTDNGVHYTLLQPLTAAQIGGNYGCYSCDLSAYAGQSVRIAIRHFDYDKYYLYLDQVEFFDDGGEPEGGPVVFTVASVEGRPGETVTVSVTVEGENFEADALCAVIGYDEAAVEPLGLPENYDPLDENVVVRPGGILLGEDGTLIPETFDVAAGPGSVQITCGWSGEDGAVLNREGTLVEITFTVKADRTEDIPITIEIKDFRRTPAGADAVIIPYTAVDGMIQMIIENWTVQFVDWDGTVIDTQEVSTGQAATAPEDPSREGYTFIGWDTDFSSVTSDLTVTAQYEINKYTVTFLGQDGTELRTQAVEHGGAAEAPVPPQVEGFHFVGWDTDFSCVTSDLTVTAVYEADFLLGDVNGDGEITVLDALLVLRYAMGIITEF